MTGEPVGAGGPAGAGLAAGLVAGLDRSPVTVLAALADPMRWLMLTLLGERARSASALARELPISRAAVLKHLGVLERGELVRRGRVGREVRYDVRPERLLATADQLHRVASGWDARLDALHRLAEGPSG